MRYFFYGTLMDRDLLRAVLESRVKVSELRPATLRGYRRSGVKGKNFPILLKSRMAAVKGGVLNGVGLDEGKKLTAYEGNNYFAVPHMVRVANTLTRPAQVFLPVPGALAPTGKPWSFSRWAKIHKKQRLKRLMQRTPA